MFPCKSTSAAGRVQWFSNNCPEAVWAIPLLILTIFCNDCYSLQLLVLPAVACTSCNGSYSLRCLVLHEIYATPINGSYSLQCFTPPPCCTPPAEAPSSSCSSCHSLLLHEGSWLESVRVSSSSHCYSPFSIIRWQNLLPPARPG